MLHNFYTGRSRVYCCLFHMCKTLFSTHNCSLCCTINRIYSQLLYLIFILFVIYFPPVGGTFFNTLNHYKDNELTACEDASILASRPPGSCRHCRLFSTPNGRFPEWSAAACPPPATHGTQFNAALETRCEFGSCTNHPDTQPLLMRLVFVYWLVVH